jgi:hypothetical protein
MFMVFDHALFGSGPLYDKEPVSGWARVIERYDWSADNSAELMRGGIKRADRGAMSVGKSCGRTARQYRGDPVPENWARSSAISTRVPSISVSVWLLGGLVGGKRWLKFRGMAQYWDSRFCQIAENAGAVETSLVIPGQTTYIRPPSR